MSLPHSDRSQEAYPPSFRAAEEDAINERRLCNAIDPRAPVVGVALSGGGIRSATFCLGLFQALARQKLIRRMDVLSTVSGGGYFGSFLGALFTRDHSTADTVERELADNHSWSVSWLRDNGRFLAPNGAGDNWLSVAIAIRNWTALHVVLVTFGFFLLAIGALLRAGLHHTPWIEDYWNEWVPWLWRHPVLHISASPWVILPAIAFLVIAVPPGTVYWTTQFPGLMRLLRRGLGLFSSRLRDWPDHEFTGRTQELLTRSLMVGLMLTAGLLVFALIDSAGQSLFWLWYRNDFNFPALWTALAGGGVALYSMGSKIYLLAEKLLGRRSLRLTFETVALGLALVWLLLTILGLSVLVFAIAWNWGGSEDARNGVGALAVAVAISFFLSWWFSRNFGFVNLSSLQQVYASRIRRAYIGASNPQRRRHQNYSMTDLIPGDDLALHDYLPHRRGGPLHLINVTVNETVSAKSQVERWDRKGVGMAIGPCGVSVGTNSHGLWTDTAPDHSGALPTLPNLWAQPTRKLLPVELPVLATAPAGAHAPARYNALRGQRAAKGLPQNVEALSVGRWAAVSGAAFTTGLGARTRLGLSLLLGLANVRLGYWWNSGATPGRHGQTTPATFLEVFGRIISRILPVQMCLLDEFFARFHGPARQQWYLSDGGHFENTGAYELVRRRVPFIICSEAGQDPRYQFADFADLVRKARTDFGAEIEVVRRRTDGVNDDPGVTHPLPRLEDFVHPDLLDVIGSPDDFPPLPEDPDDTSVIPTYAKRHALLARVHYLDNDQFSWLLLIKPSLMGDEAMDVIQYQRTHPLFPQEPTADQFFDEAQWESYRKLGEHIGTELFTPPADPTRGWFPGKMSAPL